MIEHLARIAVKNKYAVELAWSPDGTMLAASYKDRAVRVWKRGEPAGEWTQVCELRGHASWLHGVSWSFDNRYLASASEDDTVRIWDVREAKERHTLDQGSAVTAACWSPLDHALAVGSAHGRVRIYDGESGKLAMEVPRVGAVRAMVWHPKGTELFAAEETGPIRILRRAGWNLHPDLLDIPVDSRQALSMACFRKGPTIGFSNGEIVVYGSGRVLERHSQGVCCLSYSNDRQLLASGAPGEPVCLWRTDRWEFVTTLPGRTPKYFPYGLAFHPFKPMLAVVSDDGASIKLMGLDTAALLSEKASESTAHYANAKVVLVGDSGVGKTGLGLVLAGNSFSPTESTHKRNVWTFRQTTEPSADGTGVLRETLLWDLAGQPGYRLVHQLSLNDVAVALILFDARNETDPFGGALHWNRALKLAQRASGMTGMKKFLVAARIDRGKVAVSRARIQQFLTQHGFDGYFETSAKEGAGIAELKEQIIGSIDWEGVGHVSSCAAFEAIREFFVRERERGLLLATEAELYHAFRGPEGPDETQFRQHIVRLESRGQVRRLGFGGLVLLQPELLDAYASAIVNAARDEPDGLGSISEEAARQGRFAIPKEDRVLDRHREELLLIATVEELIRHEIALREQTDRGPVLVLPSQFTREWPEAPNPPNRTAIHRFEGPVANIYSTLVVRLSRSGIFELNGLWKNAARFKAKFGGSLGLYLREPEEGRGELSVMAEPDASAETRFHFEDYVSTHLERRAIPDSVTREAIFVCGGCGTPVTPEQVKRRLERKLEFLNCVVCDARIALTGPRPSGAASMVGQMDDAAIAERERQRTESNLQGRRKAGDYDVFICYNKDDQEQVQRIAERLLEAGILPWMDVWDLKPGCSWLEAIETQLEVPKAAAVFVGRHGLAAFQRQEVNALLSRDRAKAPLIPVLLPEGPQNLPALLAGYQWVDFGKPAPDPLERLIWGITGKEGSAIFGSAVGG